MHIRTLQISDIHLSKFHGENGANFRRYVQQERPLVAPAFTLATGDIVDSHSASHAIPLHTHQQLDEWQFAKTHTLNHIFCCRCSHLSPSFLATRTCVDREYKTVLEEAGLWGSDLWVDMVGNHDVMGVQDDKADNFLAAQYLSWLPSREGLKTPEYVYTKNNTRVQIVLMNAASFPGVALNYVGDFSGSLASGVRSKIDSFQASARESGVFAHSFLGSHYCFSTMATTDWRPAKRKVLTDDRYFTAHFCGHDHMFDMATRVGSDPLEMEVGSLAFNDAVRVVAIDNGVFSATDRKLGEWPFFVLTNPLPATLLNEATPLEPAKNSDRLLLLLVNHPMLFFLVNSPNVFIPGIRMLMWTDESHPVSSVSASVDGVVVSEQAVTLSKDNPLVTLPWDATKYSSGIHKLEVVVKGGSDGNTVLLSKTVEFSLDGTPRTMNYTIGRVFLEMPFIELCLAFFICTSVASLIFFMLLPLVLDYIFYKTFSTQVCHLPFPFHQSFFFIVIAYTQTMSVLTDVVLNDKSPYDFIVNPSPGKHVPTRAERNTIVALWPFVTTMVQVGRESIAIVIVSAIFGVLPLCLPLAFGYSGLPKFCASMPWGWAYCSGSATIEVFSLLIAAGYYVLVCFFLVILFLPF